MIPATISCYRNVFSFVFLLLFLKELNAPVYTPVNVSYKMSGPSTSCLFHTHKVKHFLWPRWALVHGMNLIELLQSERFVSRPLLVHAFSIGGYTFTQLLVHVSKDTQKYQSLTKRIKGQVFDSLVVGTVERMASGTNMI